jgi:hypothetical protein
MDVPRHQILKRPVPLVVRFDSPSLFRSGRCFLMRTTSSLDARLLIHAQHVICLRQRLAFPHARVQVESRTGLLGKPWVLWNEQFSCCHGLIADSSNIRHRVLRLIFLPSVALVRRTSGERLPTQGFFRLSNDLARRRLA